MELKDVILSTLAELDETFPEQQQRSDAVKESSLQQHPPKPSPSAEAIGDEALYLESIKERLLVLFEGFQSPNNTQIEAKVDLTLNFLEYLLSTIDTRIDKLKKSGRL